MAGHLKHTHEVDLKNALPFRGFELLERLVAAEIPSVVDKDVNARRLTDDMCEGFCDLVRARDIDL